MQWTASGNEKRGHEEEKDEEKQEDICQIELHTDMSDTDVRFRCHSTAGVGIARSTRIYSFESVFRVRASHL